MLVHPICRVIQKKSLSLFPKVQPNMLLNSYNTFIDRIKEVFLLSPKKSVCKGSYVSCVENKECNSYPRFRVSSCPSGPQESSLTPVYGSIIADIGNTAAMGMNVDFDTVGPFNGTTPNIVDNSITINTQGVYTISFSTELNAFGPVGLNPSVVFRLTINGVQNPISEIIFRTHVSSTTSELDTLSRTDLLTLNPGDVLRVLITNASGNIFYFNSVLVVTKVG